MVGLKIWIFLKAFPSNYWQRLNGPEVSKLILPFPMKDSDLHTNLSQQDHILKLFISGSIQPPPPKKKKKKRCGNDLILTASNSFLLISPHLELWYFWQTYFFVVDKVIWAWQFSAVFAFFEWLCNEEFLSIVIPFFSVKHFSRILDRNIFLWHTVNYSEM